MENGFKFVNDIPECMGISSYKTQKFIKSVSDKCPLMRAFMLIKDNLVAAEGYFKPFDYKTEFKGNTLRAAAAKILSGGSAEGVETVSSEKSGAVFVFMTGAPASGDIKNEIKAELSEIGSDREKIDCAVMDSYEKLLLYLSELKTPLPGKDREEESEKAFGGKVYSLSGNGKKPEWVRLSFGDKTIALRFKDENGENEIYIGRGAYRKFSFAPLEADGYAAGYWETETCFVVVTDFIGNRTGGMKLAFDFEGGKLKITAENPATGTKLYFEGTAAL